MRKGVGIIKVRNEWLLNLTAAILVVIAICEGTNLKRAKTDIGGKWPLVTERWPIQEQEFFVAIEQGHHFITVTLPNDLSDDLDVELQFYYSYKETRPVLQMPVKAKNIEINLEDTALDQGQWLTHRIPVKRSERMDNEIRYNIILHRDGDVFAWRLIKINSKSVTTTVTTEAGTVSSSTETAITETSTIQNPTENTKTELSTMTSEASAREATASSGNTNEPNYQNDQPATTPRTVESTPNGDLAAPNTEPTSETEITETKLPESPNNEGIPTRRKRGTEKKGSTYKRIKRWANLQDQGYSFLCKPSSCDKSKINHPRFMAIVGPLKITKDDLKKKKLYLNKDGKPLSLNIEYEDITKSDCCIDLGLYMDQGTELELFMSDTTVASGMKSLERIKRKPGDSGANKWEQFKRCTSDYVPQIGEHNMNGKKLDFTFQPHSSGHKKIALLIDSEKAVGLRKPFDLLSHIPNINRLSVDEIFDNRFSKFWLMDRDGTVKPTIQLESTSQQEKSSVLHISNIDPKQESFDLTSRWIKINNLETLENPLFFIYRADRAEWIKSLDFEYQSSSSPPGSWLSTTVYVEFNPISSSIKVPLIYNLNSGKKSLTNQNISNSLSSSTPSPPVTTSGPETSTVSGDTSTPQISSTPPTTTPSAPQTTKESTSTDSTTPSGTISPNLADTTTSTSIEQTTQIVTSETSTAPSEIVTTIASVAGISSRGQILIPVRLRGLNSEEFRLRVRHNLKDEAKLSTTKHELIIKTLAFGDACAENSFCLNGGKCEPTGTGTANCSCKPGYSGEHCEIVKPCEVEYGDKTGDQLCQSTGSKCIRDIPVFRCVWPDDKYYQCKPLYQANSDGNLIPLPPDPNPPQLLQERIEEQQRLIIILSVFMGALFLFSIVIIGNMITKLMKSKRRLKKAETDVHELSRRSMPGTSGGRFVSTSTGRNKAAAVVSYNNQAFDAE